MGNLDKDVAIVTGAAVGLGEAVARLFVAEGARVLITDVDEPTGAALAHDLGENARFLRLDVTREEDWQAAVAFTEQEFGPVTVLVNNAGIADQVPFEQLDVARFQKTLDINQVSVLLSYRTVTPSMDKAGRGSIVNISSVSGFKGYAGQVAYSGSKFAMRGMTRAAANELVGRNIRVNSVHPGGMNTPMLEHLRVQNPEVVAEGEATTPMKRFAETSEIAEGVLFFASRRSSYCTGSELVMDGGIMA